MAPHFDQTLHTRLSSAPRGAPLPTLRQSPRSRINDNASTSGANTGVRSNGYAHKRKTPNSDSGFSSGHWTFDEIGLDRPSAPDLNQFESPPDGEVNVSRRTRQRTMPIQDVMAVGIGISIAESGNLDSFHTLSIQLARLLSKPNWTDLALIMMRATKRMLWHNEPRGTLTISPCHRVKKSLSITGSFFSARTWCQQTWPTTHTASYTSPLLSRV